MIEKLSNVISNVKKAEWKHANAVITIFSDRVEIEYNLNRLNSSPTIQKLSAKITIFKSINIDMNIKELPFRLYGITPIYEFPKEFADVQHSARKTVTILDKRS